MSAGILVSIVAIALILLFLLPPVLAFLAVASVVFILWGDGARADEPRSLKAMESGRADLVALFLDPDLPPDGRATRIAAAVRQQAERERQLVRDHALMGRNTPAVRRIYADYDLSFLAKASLQADRYPIDLWLSRIGLTSEAVLGARVVRQ
jgi:hypothetical protein